MKNPKTSLLRAIHLAFRQALAAQKQPEIPFEEWFEANTHQALNRRDFLRRSTHLGLTTAALASPVMGRILSPLKPRIAVVGAGIGGLSVGYYLQKAGVPFTLYEASRRTSGRMMTVQNAMAAGTWTEFGGEFIDTGHLEMHRLVQDLGLTLLDVDAESEKKFTKELFFFEGKRYTQKDVTAAFLPYANRIQTDASSLSETIDYQNSTPTDKAFDRMSVDEYLQKIDLRGWLATMLQVAYTGEYGLETSQQSALNFITLLGTDVSGGELKLFGDSDERYKVIGGNQQIPDRLADAIRPNIRMEHRLTELRELQTGEYVLSFEQGKTVRADVVVLAMPFTMLRQVELKRAKLDEWKRRSIAYLGYGTNSKLMLGFERRLWREQGYLGFMYHPDVHTGWDNSQLQNNNTGACGYSIFMGGAAGKALSIKQADRYLDVIEAAFPGTKAVHTQQRRLMNWGQHPYAQGSYTCYQPGQWTSIGYAEGIPQGNIHFVGEHCSVESQGYMNGAAESGRQTAEKIIASLG